jgi:hypothetical protein
MAGVKTETDAIAVSTAMAAIFKLFITISLLMQSTVGAGQAQVNVRTGNCHGAKTASQSPNG